MMRSQCLLGLRSFVAFAAKLWSFVLYLLRRQVRTVIQYQTVRYDVLPLSPISRNRLSEEEDPGAGPGRDPDPLPPRRRPEAHGAARDPPRLHPQGGDRQTPREVLRAQTAPRGFLPGGGEPVVRAGGVHGQHGDLRLRRGRQAGQQPQHPQPALLPTALHAGVGQLHQRPVGGAQRPVQHRHPGQLTWRLQEPPRQRHPHQVVVQ
ncbi:CTD nuclear envelope phosphatase 1 isoform X3 [Taeniopygia guttata]|uniref:CTD nuclear envelope phosphatase 1 isoform X3 n=1 Tax=Taeniopygia guttata TaxID=59729 RepID=UPI003BB8C61D